MKKNLFNGGLRLMEEKLQFATEREKEAYGLRQEGCTFKTISEKMGISESRANRLVKSAERRIRQFDFYYERKQEQRKKDLEIYDLKMSYGELRIIADILYEKLDPFERQIPANINADREVCKSKFPYEYFLMCDALNSLVKALDLPTYLYDIR